MANWSCISILMLVVYLDMVNHGFVEGRNILNENRKLPKAKGTIKTIECPEDGDVIDCVDFWKQPAFDNPLTKKFQESIQSMESPRSYHDALNESAKPIRRFHKWNKYGECPKGTIPIKRIQNNNNATTHHRRHLMGVSNDQIKHEHAVVHSPRGTYHGTIAKLNFWNPFVVTEPPGSEEFSLAQMWVTSQDGERETLNSIEAGWIVYPNKFHTAATRLFIYWTKDNYETSGCYNAGENCPGFVVTHDTFSFDCDMDVSVYGEEQRENFIGIIRDRTNGVWNFNIGKTKVGHWPPNLFTSLGDGADQIDWGGEVAYKVRDEYHTTTQMGSGHFANERWKKAAYFRQIMVRNANFDWEHIDRDTLTIDVEFPTCYNLELGPAGTRDYTFFYYGGPGGQHCDRLGS